jgi:hypothetical protein
MMMSFNRPFVLITRLNILVTGLMPILLLIIYCDKKPAENWKNIADGFSLGKFESPQKAEIGDSKITIIKIDANKYEVGIYCASEYHKRSRSTRNWAKEFDLIACINAGMYAKDYLTSVGYLKSGKHLNNPNLNQTYQSIFACNPSVENVSAIKLIDRRSENFSAWKDKYSSFLQGIRMVSYERKNVWKQQQKKWSIAALAVDRSENLMLIHCRSQYSVHDFINILLELPLNIERAMYLEGGPPASLFYKLNSVEENLVGTSEGGFFLNPNDSEVFKLPNIIGIKKKH